MGGLDGIGGIAELATGMRPGGVQIGDATLTNAESFRWPIDRLAREAEGEVADGVTDMAGLPLGGTDEASGGLLADGG